MQALKQRRVARGHDDSGKFPMGVVRPNLELKLTRDWKVLEVDQSDIFKMVLRRG